MDRFATREDFEHHHIQQNGVPPDVVRDLSDYMIAVQSIISYAFVGNSARMLGVLCLDLQAPVWKDKDNRLWFEQDGNAVLIDWDSLRLLFSMVQTLLESSERE